MGLFAKPTKMKGRTSRAHESRGQRRRRRHRHERLQQVIRLKPRMVPLQHTARRSKAARRLAKYQARAGPIEILSPEDVHWRSISIIQMPPEIDVVPHELHPANALSIIVPRRPGRNEFQCQACGAIHPKNRSDEEAAAELGRNFPGMKIEDCGVTCDDCFNRIFAALQD